MPLTLKNFNKVSHTYPAGIYWNQSKGLISLSIDGETWVTMADKNLGATQVYNYGDTLTTANCGNWYQRGNNYGFTWNVVPTVTNASVDATNYGPGNYYNSGNIFRYSGNPVYGWDSSFNMNLWGGVTGTVEAMQGPCPNGFHIPTVAETAIVNTFFVGSATGESQDFFVADAGRYLKIPPAGGTFDTDGSKWNVGTMICLHTSQYYTSGSKMCTFWNIWDLTSSTPYKGEWQTNKNNGPSRLSCIRPFKNVPEIPDNSWTVLYQHINTPGIYYSSAQGLITMSSDGTNWITMSDKNLGASSVYNYGNAYSETNCGKYFQRGNNNQFVYSGSVSTSSTKVNASTYGPTSYYSGSSWILVSTLSENWDSSNNANLWGNTTDTLAARKGPCSAGYHVPTKEELQSIYDIGYSLGLWESGQSTYDNIIKLLHLPLAGWRRFDTGNTQQSGVTCYYRSSSFNNTPYYLSIYTPSSAINIANGVGSSRGSFIRPFKNISNIPTSNWTKIG